VPRTDRDLQALANPAEQSTIGIHDDRAIFGEHRRFDQKPAHGSRVEAGEPMHDLQNSPVGSGESDAVVPIHDQGLEQGVVAFHDVFEAFKPGVFFQECSVSFVPCRASSSCS